MNSGKFSGGGGSNFSHTCSLLSQYLKNKGSFGDLTHALNPTSEPKGAPAETMNLLSMIERSGTENLHAPPPPVFSGGRNEIQNKAEVEKAPMTIFYGGQIIVFNDFPADKATEIMKLASKSSATRNDAESTTTAFGIEERPSLDSDLPIARKNSLTRFLEKRRDRVTATAPYPTTKQAAPRSETKSEAWLGLRH